MTDASADPDVDLATQLATDAGALLVRLRASLDAPGAEPDAIRADGDRAAHLFLLAELARRRPDDSVLSEEGTDDPARVNAERVWIVDPLDGTREFGESGRTDWAVHVALVSGGDVLAAAVALPARSLTLSSSSYPTLEPVGDPPRVIVSRSRPPAIAERIAAELGAVLVPCGSAGAKAIAVVLGDADVYAHDGGQYEWDSAAPVGVAAAAGLHTSRLDGSPLRYNRPDPWLPDLLICRQELAPAVLAITAR